MQLTGIPDSKEEIGKRESVTSCVRRLLELGLPEKYALLARDAVRAHYDNFEVRKRLGEFDDRTNGESQTISA